jgi:hypothetical protein
MAKTQYVPASSPQQHDKPALWREYFGVEPSKLLVLGAAVLGAAVLTTIPYVLVTGYDKWKNDMGAASDLMLAEFPTSPSAAAPSAATPYSSVAPGNTSLRAGSARGERTRQYTCPVCGTAASPTWTSDGNPTCPSCGNTMTATP